MCSHKDSMISMYEHNSIGILRAEGRKKYECTYIDLSQVIHQNKFSTAIPVSTDRYLKKSNVSFCFVASNIVYSTAISSSDV